MVRIHCPQFMVEKCYHGYAVLLLVVLLICFLVDFYSQCNDILTISQLFHCKCVYYSICVCHIRLNEHLVFGNVVAGSHYVSRFFSWYTVFVAFCFTLCVHYTSSWTLLSHIHSHMIEKLTTIGFWLSLPFITSLKWAYRLTPCTVWALFRKKYILKSYTLVLYYHEKKIASRAMSPPRKYKDL